MTEERIRFAQHVYEEIMNGQFHTARTPTKWSSGVLCGPRYTLHYEYKWFGTKREVTLQRIVKEDAVSFAYHRIRTTPEEEELLWSVWPTVNEIQKRCRQRKIEEQLKRAEELQWWP